MKKEEKMTPYLIAQQKIMIWRTKMIGKGFKKEEYEQYEKDVFNGYISKDVAETLQKSKEVQNEIIKISNQIKNDSKKASMYFLLTVLVAIGAMLLSLSLKLSSW